MNLLTNFLISYNLKTLPSMDKKQIYELLHPYLAIHKMNITEDKIVFSDLNLSTFYSITQYEKMDFIYLKEVILIMDQPDGFIRIILRSGYFHALSKNSSIRLHRHMFESNRITSRLEILFWKSITTMALLFRKKTVSS